METLTAIRRAGAEHHPDLLGAPRRPAAWAEDPVRRGDAPGVPGRASLTASAVTLQSLLCNAWVSSGVADRRRRTGPGIIGEYTSRAGSGEPMVETVLRRRSRRRAVDRGWLVAAAEYAAMGWPVCVGAFPPHAAAARGDACGPAPVTGSAVPHPARIRCPRPGRSRPARIPTRSGDGGWRSRKRNVILATGRVFDVLDVPPQRAPRRSPRWSDRPSGPVPSRSARGAGPCFLSATRGTSRRRARVVVLPARLRARGDTPRSPACAGTAADSYVLAPAVAGRQRGPRRTGSARRTASRCPTGCGCWSSWPTPARRSADERDQSGGAGQLSAELFERACAVAPGGVNSPVRAFGAVGGTPGGHGVGARAVPDRRGRARVRRPGLLLGPDDPRARPSRGHRAVQRALAQGHPSAPQRQGEVELAEELVARAPVDKVRLVSSGTEATMSALRLARGFTGGRGDQVRRLLPRPRGRAAGRGRLRRGHVRRCPTRPA